MNCFTRTFRRRLLPTLWVVILLLTGLLASCSGSSPSGPPDLSGRILVWHSWADPDKAALEEILGTFESLHPQVHIKRMALSPASMQTTLIQNAQSGLGPDLIFAPNGWVRLLADARAIRPIDDLMPEDVLGRFVPAALETLRYKDELFGLPISLNTKVLYYNPNLVEKLPVSLDELLLQAQEGHEIALPTNFYAAFWGIQAFGGRLLDPESERIVLDRGGFANWLAWLKSAREIPGILMDANQEALTQRFRSGQVAYYVGDSQELSDLETALGVGNVGVVVLPAGPNGSAGPLLNVEALLFNRSSSPNQAQIASALAQFITNSEQQGVLLRRTRRTPANSRVRLNPRLNPFVTVFAAQARTAVPVRNLPQVDLAFQLGNDAYARSLEGVLGPMEAATELTAAINQAAGFDQTPGPIYACQGVGTIGLWHSWQGAQAQALEQIIHEFAQICPTIIVRTRALEPAEIRSRYVTAAAVGNDPELVIGPSSWVPEMAANNLIKEISAELTAQTMQEYRPIATEAMRLNGRLYGLPLWVDTTILFANNDLATEPIQSLDGLSELVDGSRVLGIPTGFEQAFWGIQAFGGRLFDEQNRVILDQGGFVDWLTWLAAAQTVPGVRLSNSAVELQAAFAAGELAYVVGPASGLAGNQTALGKGRVRVSVLPDGPANHSAPLLQVEGIFLNGSIGPEQTAIGLEFARFLTGATAQRELMEMTGYTPANATADLAGYPENQIIVDQIQTAVLLPKIPELSGVLAYGGDAYALALSGASPPAEAVAEVTARMNELNSGVVAEIPFICQGAGSVSLAHLWPDDVRQKAINEVIADFTASCPDITVQIVDGSSSSLGDLLAADAGPDLVIGFNDPLRELVDADVIANLTNDIAGLDLQTISEKGLRSFQIGGQTYGLPLAFSPNALYYNRAQITNPVTSLDALLTQGAAGQRVAINGDFYAAYWGIPAFGGQLLDEQGGFALQVVPLAAWLDWLRQAQETPGVIVENEDQKLLALFETGRVAYYVGGPEALGQLVSSLGDGIVGVAPLPDGPQGAAAPLLRVQGMMINQQSTDLQRQQALQVARYLLTPQSQILLMNQANLVPVALDLGVGAKPAIAGFLAQVETSTPMPQLANLPAVWAVGVEGVQAALSGRLSTGSAAAQAVGKLAALIK